MKRVIGILLVFVLLMGLVGCMEAPYTSNPTATRGTTITRRTLPQLNFTTAQRTTATTRATTTRRTTRTTTTQKTTVTTKATTTTAAPVDTTPTFSSIIALRDYMTRCIESDQLEFSFVYTGSEAITAQ